MPKFARVQIKIFGDSSEINNSGRKSIKALAALIGWKIVESTFDGSEISIFITSIGVLPKAEKLDTATYS